MATGGTSKAVDRVWRGGALAGLVLLFTLSAGGVPHAPVRFATSEVNVRVRIFETGSRQAQRDKSGVAVWLEPVDDAQRSKGEGQKAHYRMRQHNKMFEPHLLVVPTGSVVEFPNLDPWFHNAFSISDNGRFDLGLDRTGVTKYARFDRAGASYVFCGIHPEMAAIVLAVESTYFGISDRAGHVSIDNVPPGKYLLHAWYEDAPEDPGNVQSVVLVVDDRCELPAISVAITKRYSLKREEAR